MTTDQRKAPFDAVVVVGLGLIGASLTAALRKAYPGLVIFGVDTDGRSCVVAQERGWVTEASRPDDPAFCRFLAEKADLVVLATPVAAVDEYMSLLAQTGYAGVLTDTVSTKAHLIEAASELLPDPSIYVPGHPMAGSEKAGVDSARSDLYEGVNWILCPDETTDPDAFQKLHELICGMDARVVSLPREVHDDAVAIVSHVPHMVASALMQLALAHVDESRSLLRLAAGGFKDTTRVAAGSPELWCGIAFDNASALAAGLDEMEGILSQLRETLESGDKPAFTRLLSTAAEARRQLPAAWVPGSDKLIEVRIPMVNRTGVVAEVTTIASSVGCNIQSIEIDHVSEGNAVLSLVLTDEGDIGQLSYKLIDAGYAVSFSPLSPKEHSHVE
ncbi:prephenate dehydrogenase [Adlercreutzia murintestinalis]|uniref:prephenate dehydrogenase n=1 Tax=Adlercreutzia murintestinalis TaxID=2941325 RepID=UPI00203A9FFC|nr:prephenate dehydrogenase/arogenate dehydrogenase family protein [Adlercreutzia murintestinalis]